MKIQEVLSEAYDPFDIDGEEDEMDTDTRKGNLVVDLVNAKDVIDELGNAANPKDKEMKKFKFKDPVISFADGRTVAVKDTEDFRDPKYLPLKFVDLFLEKHGQLKTDGATQMQNDAVKSRKDFFQSIKNAIDGKYGSTKQRSTYDELKPGRGGGPTYYT
jgi:hypothetical protein